MKASRFTDAQKAYILNQGEDGMTVAEVCRKAGISQATYFTCTADYWSERASCPTRRARVR